MRINNNIMAMNTHRQYAINNDNMAKATSRLSSGYRINNAADDAAGLAISEKMRAQIRGLNMASKNSQDAISLVQTAEGALEETESILQRMRELSVQSASDTNQGIDRNALDAEFQQLIKEIDDIAKKADFNGTKLLDGSMSEGFQTNATGTAGATGAESSEAAGIALLVEDSFAITDSDKLAAGDYSLTYADGSGQPDTLTLTVGGGKTYTIQSGATGSDSNFAGSTEYDILDGGVATGAKITFSTAMASALTGSANFGGARLSISDVNDQASIVGGISFKASDEGGPAFGDYKASYAAGVLTLSDGVNTYTADLNAGGIPSAGTVDLKNASDKSVGSISVNAAALEALGNAGATSLLDITISEDKSITIQTGSNEGDTLAIGINDMSSKGLKVNNSSIATRASASKAITTVGDAINAVSTQRASLGAMQNRLEHKINNLDTSAENLQSAESRIRDIDMAKEMTKYTQTSILVQAATSMLAQANNAPQNVLSLLR